MRCLYAMIHEADWDSTVELLTLPTEQTYFGGSIGFPSADFDSVSPGDQIHLQLTFQPALVVTSNVLPQATILVGGTDGSGSNNEFMEVSHILQAQGSWSRSREYGPRL